MPSLTRWTFSQCSGLPVICRVSARPRRSGTRRLNPQSATGGARMAAVPEYIHQQTEESLERWKERALKAEETIAEVQDVVGAPAKSKLAEVAKRIRRLIPGAFVDVYERFGFYQ